MALSTPLAMAQWQWVDGNGRKVFSDQPPPSDIPPQQILKQPSARIITPESAASTTDAAAPTQAKASTPAAAQDPELQKIMAQKKADEAAKKKAEEERVAKLKAQNCQLAKTTQSTLDSGRPMTQTDTKGERTFLDQKQRDAESKRMREVMSSNC